MGPAMMPFLRHRAGDRWWRLALGFLWLPAIVVVITVQQWLHFSATITWISLGVMFVGFVAFVFLSDRRMD